MAVWLSGVLHCTKAGEVVDVADVTNDVVSCSVEVAKSTQAYCLNRQNRLMASAMEALGSGEE